MSLFDLTWWQYLLVTLILTHITIVAVTIFLHRNQAHRTLSLAAPVSHFFRAWLWLTTGMVTREWVAVHRKHHALCEQQGDPHSPQIEGINRVLWSGALLYRKAASDPKTLETYGKGVPNDWLEQNLYRHSWVGVGVMLVIDFVLLGPVGALVWLAQMLWIPFWAAGVINGIGHYWGYRNWNTSDASTNIVPLGLLIGGEELHNNHHAFASSARLSSRWYEFDIGWWYIRLLAFLRLAKIHKVAPRLRVRPGIRSVDVETVTAVLGNRLQVLSNYARQVIRPVAKAELCRSTQYYRKQYRIAKRLLTRTSLLDDSAKQMLLGLIRENQALETVYYFQECLLALWERTTTSQEARRQALQDWIRQAEATGIEALTGFARQLRGYSITTG